MQLFATIASVTNLKKELTTLMGIIPSKKFNRCNRREKLLEKKKPTVACRLLNSSIIFWLTTHCLRLASYHSPSPRGFKPKKEKEEEELLL